MSNEVIRVLKERRSIRGYRPEPVPEGTLNEILDAGIWSPTGRGAQNPLIVAVKDEDTLAQLRRMNGEVLGSSADPYYGAPHIFLVFSPTDGHTYIEDASCVLTYMMVAAKSLGVDTCWVHREREMFGTDEGKALKTKWGIPEKYEGIGSLAVGYAKEAAPAPAARKPDYVRWV
ncbi:MAG: nitroreductase [Clostridiales Family XIII bacterium]|nr:nitroreductase [Clostridiales Family XIII bacterium]